jgi:hypothetical protein
MKPVFRQVFFATKQLEALGRHNQMQIAGLLTYRAAALMHY